MDREMVIAVLLVLLCCWRLTDESGHVESGFIESGHIESGLTGETLRADRDFLVHSTSDQNTLYTNTNKTDNVSDSITTEKFHTTKISNGREVAHYLHPHEDGNKVLAHFKENNAIRDFVDKEHGELYVLKETIETLYQKVDETAVQFITGNEESVMHVALETAARLVENLVEYVNRSKELNAFIDRQNSSAENELKIKDIDMIEDEVRGALNYQYQMVHLFNIIVINEKYKEFQAVVRQKPEEYKKTRDVSLLDENVRDFKEMIKLLKEHIREAKLLSNFRQSHNLELLYSNNYTDELVNVETWESELQIREQDLTKYERLLEEETFSLLLARYVNPFMQSVIFIVGIIGNGVLLIVFARHRHMRTPPNLTVLNLTLGDFLSLICNILVYDVVDVSGGVWHYGPELCKAYRFIRHLCLGVTVYSIVVISIQRFFALSVYCTGHGLGCRVMKKYTSLLIISSAWLMASAIAIPRTVNAGVFNNRCLGYGFENVTDYYRLVNTIDFVALCIVPLAIITVFSTATARRIRDSIKNMPGEMVGMQKMKEARLLSSKILIALTAVFAVCYVPYFLYAFLSAWFNLNVSGSANELISYVTFSLIFANSCFNPIAVYLASRKYRVYMKKYLLCKRWELDQDGRITSTETSSVETHM